MKKQRRCSVCRKTGHDKRACSKTEVKKTKKPSPKPSVFVQVGRQNKKSPHLVDLRDQKKYESLGDIKVYEEKNKLPQIETIDFAAMVRQANSQVGSQKRFKKTKIKKEKEPSLRLANVKKIEKRISPKIKLNLGNRIHENVAGLVEKMELKKIVVGALALLLIVLLPFPAVGYYQKLKDDSYRVAAESTNAFLALQSSTYAALGSDIPQAEYDLNLALESFNKANSILDKEHRALVYVSSLLPILGDQVSSRQHLLSAGHHLALGNTYLVRGMDLAQNSDKNFTDKLGLLRAHLRSSMPQYQEALADLSAVSESVLPVEYQESFSEFKLLFATFVDDMQDLSNLTNALRLILGDDELKTYLLVFQNNYEIRPTGGFMGSFAKIDLQKGRMLDWEVPGGGTYDLQGQLDVFVKPPLPLQLANNRWEFQDANWFPDFAASAQKIEWFYQHGRGETLDGVIAINASVLTRMLAVIGSLESKDHELILVTNDALVQLQEEVENNYDKEKNQPKEVVEDLFGQLLTKMESVDSFDFLRLLTELHDALNEKEIQIYLNDEKLQQELRDYGWTGELKPAVDFQDYLMVVNTNIHGGKSDAKIQQTIEHQAVVQEDGSVIDTVFVVREHTGVPGEEFYGLNNVDYVRIYVPEGSELIDAGGFVWPEEDLFKVAEDWYEEDVDLVNYEEEKGYDKETGTRVTNEFGYTAFGNWVMVEPGQKVQAYFSYKLPFNVFDLEKEEVSTNILKWKKLFSSYSKEASSYSLFVQKQSGINSHFISSVIYPDFWQPVWRSEEDMDLAQNGAMTENDLDTDKMYGLVMENNN